MHPSHTENGLAILYNICYVFECYACVHIGNNQLQLLIFIREEYFFLSSHWFHVYQLDYYLVDLFSVACFFCVCLVLSNFSTVCHFVVATAGFFVVVIDMD